MDKQTRYAIQVLGKDTQQDWQDIPIFTAVKEKNPTEALNKYLRTIRPWELTDFYTFRISVYKYGSNPIDHTGYYYDIKDLRLQATEER